MGDTGIVAMDKAIPEVWSAEVLVEGEKQQFWFQFEGPQGSGMPIIRKDDLTKMAGDTIHLITISNLTGAGVTGESTLTGSEETLAVGEVELTISRIRHAIRFTRDAVQRSIFDCRTAAKGRLAYWLADKMDAAMFSIATASNTYNVYSGSATSVGTLASTDTMSAKVIMKAKAKLETLKALPIRTRNGNRYFGLVMHTYDEYNLKNDTTYNQNVRDAGVRGDENRIFTGSLGIYDGMILYVSANVPNSASKSLNVAFGGEAFARAYGQYPDWVEEWFDYKNLLGIATSVVYGDKRAVESNTVVINTYAADPNA